MNHADFLAGRNAFDDHVHFDVPLVSLAEDVATVPAIFRNYAEAGLRAHLRHGFAFRTRLPRPMLSLCHPRHVCRVLRSHVLNYPKSEDYATLRPLLGNGIFVSDGELWARQRRLLSPEFRPGTVQRFLPVIVESVEAVLTAWSESAARGEARDVSDDMLRLTLWGIGGALFQSDFRDDYDRIGRALEVCLAQSTRQMLSAGLLQPWMPTPGNLRARRAERELDGIVRGVIARRRERPGDGDIISRLLVAKDEETGGVMTEGQVLDEVKSLILAGHETTSLTLSWALYLLAGNPDVAARLVDEVTRVLGGRAPAAEDLGRLEYTRAVFFEAMRLYPPVPGVSRVARAADRFDDIEVRAGELVGLSLYVTHRHPSLWERPEAFDPDRFVGDNVARIAPYSYLPFLVGRRVCLGEHFAIMEGVAALAMLVDRFTLERVDAGPIGTRPMATLRLARPLRMRPRPRRA